jgi:general secretion pathway protein D
MRKLSIPLSALAALALTQLPGHAALAQNYPGTPGAQRRGPGAPPPRPYVPGTPRAGSRANRVSPPPAQTPPPASQRGSALVTPAPEGTDAGSAGGPSQAEGRCEPLKGKFLLAFNKADIVDVLEQASRWTCRNFAYTEDIARGKITLLSKTPVTSEEAYAAFLAALNSNNIAIYHSGRYYKLVRSADAKKVPIPTILEEGAEVPALEQPVTKIFRLHYADADQLRGVMGNFTSPQGADLQSIPPDVLIITDIGLNVRRIERMIEALDRPGSGELIRFIQVKYAPARDLAEKVNQIFQGSTGSTPPGRGVRRPVIGGVAPTGAPGTPGGPAAAHAGGDEGGLSISKVMADERTNKLVVIADEKAYERIKDLVEQLDVPTAGEGQIHVLFMKNASAEDLAQTLQALAQGQASKRPNAPTPTGPIPIPAATTGGGGTTAALFSGEVKITADKIANALIVLASGSDYVSIQRLVDRLDQPRRQVFVEAAILEVNLQDETDFGVSAHTAIPFQTSNGTGFIPLASETGRLNTLSPASVIQLGGFLTGAVGPTTAELSALGFQFPSMGVLLQALQTSSDVNVISTPHVLATDNEDAEITVGQNVPFLAGVPNTLSSLPTTTGSTATNPLLNTALLGAVAPIQRQNVELRLRIKPQITEGDSIRLTIDEQTEEIASNDRQLGPTTSKRSIKTNISVKDQSTIVIGGLIQERAIQSVHKTPLLGDIPVLGWLFRDTTTTKTKTNLLLFLTPYIIHDQSDYRRIYERKRQEQQDFMQQFYGTQSKYEPPIDYHRKSSPFTKVRKDVELEMSKLENGGQGAPGEGAVSPRGRIETPSSPSQQPAPSGPTPGTPPPKVAPPADPPADVPGTPGTPASPAEKEPGKNAKLLPRKVLVPNMGDAQAVAVGSP